MIRPRVTLAMPVHNGANYVEAAIHSILAQTYCDFELIITDNCSNDATEAICRRLASADPRIRYYRNAVNLGASRNYNLGFSYAQGEFLKWCAHDDLISPTFLERCVEVLNERANVSLVFARTLCIDENGEPWSGHDHGMREMPSLDGDDPIRRFRDSIVLAGTCFPIFGLFRMECLKRSTLHRSYYGSDRALIAEAALLGKIVQAPPDAIFYNREHRLRSINIKDYVARTRWQSTSAGRWASMEHINLMLNLLEVAWRHPEVANRPAALWALARVALTPLQLARYGLDLVKFITPGGAIRLRHAVYDVLDVIGKPAVSPELRGREHRS